MADPVRTAARRSVGAVAGIALLALGVVACGQASSRPRWQREGETLMREGVRTGRFADKKLEEASGAVASVSEPGVLWSQNDSGNDESLFAYDTAGRALGRVQVKGAKNRDWEALASGPCPEGQCITIGDVGDNLARRDFVALHQIAEPARSNRQASVLRSLRVRYADGAHDVEAMYAGPDGTLWLVTKRPARSASGAPRPVRVYAVPRAAWDSLTFTAPVADSLAITPERGTAHDWVTDASLSPLQPDGRRRVVLLTYGAVYVFDADPATGRPGALMARCSLPIREDTAEGVTWLPDGRILLVTEGTMGGIYAGRCP